MKIARALISVSDKTGIASLARALERQGVDIISTGGTAELLKKEKIPAREGGFEPIDLVVVNLYPFEETIAKPNVTLVDAIENIDIGGPSMVRSAAKNYRYVTVVT